MADLSSLQTTDPAFYPEYSRQRNERKKETERRMQQLAESPSGKKRAAEREAEKIKREKIKKQIQDKRRLSRLKSFKLATQFQLRHEYKKKQKGEPYDLEKAKKLSENYKKASENFKSFDDQLKQGQTPAQ